MPTTGCVGLITWMHTFSPAKMWIPGLAALQKPVPPPAHPVQPRDPLVDHRHGLHEPQPGRPWRSRVRVPRGADAPRADGRRRPLERSRRPGPDRRVDPGGERATRLGRRADRSFRRQHARGRGHRGRQGRGAAAARVQRQHATASATSSARIDDASDADVDQLVEAYLDEYDVVAGSCDRAANGRRRCATARGSRSACARFLEDGRFIAFTDTFEDLHGLKQLPGLAVQRLMADGYGFGAEGDWKTAAMVRAMKVMSARPAGRRVVHGGLHLPPRPGRRPRSSARTCSRSARRSPPADRDSRSTRCRSAARPTRSGSCSTPIPGRRSRRASPTWASRFRMVASVVDVVEPPAAVAAAARRASGLAAPAGPADERGGLDPWPAARITRASATPSRPTTYPTSRRCAGPSSSSSTTTLGLEAFRDRIRWNDVYHLLAARS